jgi:hypothetical protein
MELTWKAAPCPCRTARLWKSISNSTRNRAATGASGCAPRKRAANTRTTKSSPASVCQRRIPQCETLIEFFQRRPSREERAQVVCQLADITRRLHEAHFFGRSLVWRNILVSRSGSAGVKLFLIDCPRGGAARFGRARRRLRDLATLDKCAMQYCSRAERLRFLLAYRQQPRLDDAARAMLRGSLEYSRRRWPDEWRGR